MWSGEWKIRRQKGLRHRPLPKAVYLYKARAEWEGVYYGYAFGWKCCTNTSGGNNLR